MTAGHAGGEVPWWASGIDPGDGLDLGEDPLDAFRSARRGDATARADHGHAGGGFDGDTSRGDQDAGPGRPAGGAPHPHGEVCTTCPVCVGLRVVRSARPDVIMHLSRAAHEVSLALKALADAQVEATGDHLEHIDLDTD